MRKLNQLFIRKVHILATRGLFLTTPTPPFKGGDAGGTHIVTRH